MQLPVDAIPKAEVDASMQAETALLPDKAGILKRTNHSEYL